MNKEKVNYTCNSLCTGQCFSRDCRYRVNRTINSIVNMCAANNGEWGADNGHLSQWSKEEWEEYHSQTSYDPRSEQNQNNRYYGAYINILIYYYFIILFLKDCFKDYEFLQIKVETVVFYRKSNSFSDTKMLSLNKVKKEI